LIVSHSSFQNACCFINTYLPTATWGVDEKGDAKSYEYLFVDSLIFKSTLETVDAKK
jgi:hypothetical protein